MIKLIQVNSKLSYGDANLLYRHTLICDHDISNNSIWYQRDRGRESQFQYPNGVGSRTKQAGSAVRTLFNVKFSLLSLRECA